MDIKEQLIEGARNLNVQLTDQQVEQLIQYKEILVEWNEKMNLTAITEDFEVITKHFLDCLTVQSSIDLTKVETLVDVGTGAGFPGLVLKIAFPNVKITLIDSLNKRLKFLQHVIDTLGLQNIECVHGRAEDLGKNKLYREKFEVCASRAVANLAVLSEYTLPFVKKGGYLIALKGQKLDEELVEGEKAIKILGGEIDQIFDVVVPYTDLNHRIAKIKKVKETPRKFPRKAGEPTKAPLGQIQ
ncbi:16S rRNA (guanine(527)-N(7))-methyltransferase RsmG [Niameybacter massiliensis]|uniref:Ribosomal RNA small subunit methyltransferase G n=1 Tax=Holtiella tumoricola TaxID=3018743 RepID=A0AA42DLC5_9FIRM|nr:MULTISPECIES: 16S rRNA (guanine(527)-N(7))-methyltransferase RsmG [Lachnospirales]MDA3730932.1 16S rRNA (guanine(527)-N(7))-methyltransferase RsmG [Holtiella tumoricola]